jgi:hypothetical protein
MSEEKKAEPGAAFKTLGESIIRSYQMSHAAVVVTSAAILDQLLERAIKAKMPTVSGKLAKSIFDDRGPLNTFSAKIDMAHALDITSQAIHIELQKIRKMRNMFSHSDKILSLDVEPMRKLFYELKRPAGITGNYGQQFVACVTIISDFLELYLIRMGITDDISNKWGLVPQHAEKAPDAPA